MVWVRLLVGAVWLNGGIEKLLNPNFAAQFADALAAYCKNPDARRAAGEAGLQASREYGWDEVNQQLVEGYLRVIRQRTQGGRQPRHSPVP